MIRARKESIILAAILLATMLIYANSLSNPFITDDQYIIFKNFQPWQSWTLGGLFERSLFSTAPSESAYFRPLTLLTFALNYPLAGTKPQGYRVVNVGLHLLVVYLLAVFLRRLVGAWLAVFTALLFAVHPAHVQAVSYISSRSDPLYTVFALLCLLFWHKGNESGGGKRALYRGSALGAFFTGLFAKENIIVVPAIAVIMDLIWHPPGSWRARIRENLGWYLGFGLLFSIYLLVRLGVGFPPSMERGREFDLWSRSLYALKILSLYFGVSFYPAHLSLFRIVPVPESFFEWQVVLASMLVAGSIILARLCWLTRREISFGILWFLIAILPVSNLTLLNAPMMEHWLYFPLIGLTLAFVGCIRGLAERVGEVRGAAFAMIFLSLLLSARTVTRNAEWGDPLKMYLKDVSYYPGSWRAWSWLGDAMKARGMLNDTIRAYKTSLTINPKQIPTWVALGEVLSLAGRDGEAEEILARAVSVRPEEPWYWYLLGIHRLKAGKNQAAIEPLEKNIELNSSPMAYHALGSAYLRLGQNEKAEQAFRQAIRTYPGQTNFHSGVHIDLGKLYLRQGKLKEAREEWNLALRFEPNRAEARDLLEKTARQ